MKNLGKIEIILFRRSAIVVLLLDMFKSVNVCHIHKKNDEIIALNVEVMSEIGLRKQ